MKLNLGDPVYLTSPFQTQGVSHVWDGDRRLGDTLWNSHGISLLRNLAGAIREILCGD